MDMNKKIYILIVSLLATTFSLRAASMAQADSLYMTGDYQQAMQSYQTLIDEGMLSADLYYSCM